MKPYIKCNFADIQDGDGFLVYSAHDGLMSAAMGKRIKDEFFLDSQRYRSGRPLTEEEYRMGFDAVLGVNFLAQFHPEDYFWMRGTYQPRKIDSRTYRGNYLTHDWKVGDQFFIIKDNLTIDPTPHEVISLGGLRNHTVNYRNGQGGYNKIAIHDIVRHVLSPGELQRFKTLKSYYTECEKRVIKRHLTDHFIDQINTHSSFASFSGNGSTCMHQYTDCMSYAKTVTEDVWQWIPTEFSNFTGYSQDDIKEWYAFLNEMFREDIFSIVQTNVKIRNFGPCDNKWACHSLGRVANNDFTKVHMKGHPTKKYTTYIRYILSRYIQDQNYAHMPRMCLDMRKKLPETISNWEILLMTQTMYNFDGYYNICANMIPRLDQTFQEVLDRAEARQGMNKAFFYIPGSKNQFAKLWDRKDYMGIYNKINKLQEQYQKV